MLGFDLLGSLFFDNKPIKPSAPMGYSFDVKKGTSEPVDVLYMFQLFVNRGKIEGVLIQLVAKERSGC